MISRRDGLILVVILATAYGAVDSFLHRELKQPDGVLAPEEPFQASTARGPLKHEGFVLDPLAEYDIKARVLSTERYYADPGAKLSPIDLALGWGPMSDSKNLRDLKVSQNGRFYFFGWKQTPPIPESEISKSSANVHIIPADSVVEDQIKAFRPGQIIRLKGLLVRVNGFDGGEWKSSLTRGDTGPGACELLYVEAVL